MKFLLKLCDKFGLLDSELDYHLVRGSMALIFLFSDIRSGSSTKRRRSFRISAMDR